MYRELLGHYTLVFKSTSHIQCSDKFGGIINILLLEWKFQISARKPDLVRDSSVMVIFRRT